jgi:hypothetical protein
MAYIIFNNEQEAELRSEQAGIAKGLSYHKTGKGSRYWWGWSKSASEEDPRAYIEIAKNISVDPETDEETVSIPDQNLLTDDDILVDELPEDWVTASANPDEEEEEEEEEDND